MDVTATGASLSGGARCAVSGIPLPSLLQVASKLITDKKTAFYDLGTLQRSEKHKQKY